VRTAPTRCGAVPCSDYLDVVRDDPTVTKLAHGRFYDFITAAGSSNATESDDSRAKRLYKDEPLRVYNFKDEFFGIERTVAQVEGVGPYGAIFFPCPPPAVPQAGGAGGGGARGSNP
jgi:predicted Ser/Thr protein kinase